MFKLSVVVYFTVCIAACVASFEEKKGFLQCVCSPANNTKSAKARGLVLRALSILNSGTLENPRPVGNRVRAREALKFLVECARQTSLRECIDADAALRNNPFPHPICSYDSFTGLNLRNKGGVPDWKTTVGHCKESAENQMKEMEIDITPKFLKTEGCVAVEHLVGYQLQHAEHLLRRVLCWNGFCATPNHAIMIAFDGNKYHYTSIGQMCASGAWKDCREEFKLVNNLRIVRNSRAELTIQSGDAKNITIILTAFDVRYPRIATWIVQLAQEAVQPFAAAVMPHLMQLNPFIFR